MSADVGLEVARLGELALAAEEDAMQESFVVSLKSGYQDLFRNKDTFYHIKLFIYLPF